MDATVWRENKCGGGGEALLLHVLNERKTNIIFPFMSLVK